MPLNNVRLNAGLLSDLYKNSLVEIDEPHTTGGKNSGHFDITKESEKKQDAVDEWKYLGDYKKNILLVVNYQQSVHLPDEQLNFITSFLAACKLNLGDVAILNIDKAPSRFYKEVQSRFNSKVTVLFGLSPAEFSMPVNFPEFQVQALNNCTFLSTPLLEQLETDNLLKSKLWVCLRRVFGV
jgi:hypothetical protein